MRAYNESMKKILVISLYDGSNEIDEVEEEEVQESMRSGEKCKKGDKVIWKDEEFMYLELWVAHIENNVYNWGMDKLKELIEQMENEMRMDLKRSGDLEEYGEEGIRIAVYEDLKDSLNHLFSDIVYK